MESRRTRVTVPGAGDARARFARRALPVALVGLAVTAVAVVGDGGGVGRAHYLRQLVFGPAGPHAARPAVRVSDARDATPVVPAIPLHGVARRQ
jgi:nitrate reductase NapE component